MRRVWCEKVPFVVLSLVFVGLAVVGRVEILDPVSLKQVDLFTRTVLSCYGTWFYVSKTVLPANLTVIYAVPEQAAFLGAPFVGSILGTLGVSVGLFLLRRRWPALLAVWLSYVVILAPNLGLVRSGTQLTADRYGYLSMIGGVVLVAAGLSRLSVARPSRRFAALGLTTASLAALLGLILLTQAQCRTWRTSETLWTHILNQEGSRRDVAHNNLGGILNARGRSHEARSHYEEALRLNPDYAHAHHNLGLLLLEQGRNDEARDHFEAALRINPNHAGAHNNLGLILKDQGRIELARAQFDQALRINPNAAETHSNLGLLLFGQGRSDEARTHFNEALRIKPNDPEANFNLGLLLANQGRIGEARTHFEAALRINPNHLGAHNNLGVILKDQGRFDEARAHFEEALRINPNAAETHSNLAFLLLGQRRSDEARAHFNELVRIDPNDLDANFNLGLLLLRQGRIDEARTQFDATLRINPKFAVAYNKRAMIRATAAEAKYRDGPKAVDDATHACVLTDWKNALFLDTLAAAHAEAADFDAAVKWQTRALDLLTHETQKEDFRSRLRLYQARKPYHAPLGAQLTAVVCRAGPDAEGGQHRQPQDRNGQPDPERQRLITKDGLMRPRRQRHPAHCRGSCRRISEGRPLTVKTQPG